jgi:hypothetical protein
MTDETRRGLREALKTVAVILKQGEPPFALAGGYALWARGGPEPEHDVDFVVAEQDAAATAALIAEHGLEVVKPPEDWLFKVYVGDAMVDVIYRQNATPVGRELFDTVDAIEVESVEMPVLSATALMAAKLQALEEHACDLAKVVPAARAVREQVDWEQVLELASHNDFALATLFLLERLGIASLPAGWAGFRDVEHLEE